MSYVIAGRKVGAEWLSIATLTTFFAGVGYAMSGSPKSTIEKKKDAMPPVEASSSDEESYILNFIKEEEEKAKSALPAAH